ncbi:hypothetical protein QO058_17275 [Bosea vestrisii]|uniref:hypothetical protein n=1 Tax=Bosea vestrisii TaxID=151416 RepID=UPI0024DFB072|nr:hypothetical protein [Bosea vestrisii]WID94584.1 hypothetical protein QO058_17275 [Bosea vestrisii]
MSQAKLKANVLKILASPAVKHINFRIAGNHFYNERFTKVAVAIKVGLINVVPFKDFANPKVRGAYSNTSNMLLLHPDIGSASVSRKNQNNVIHECFHAINDMDMVQGISPTEEETCGFIAAAIYEKYHYGKSYYDKKHPMVAMLAILKGSPGYELRNDPVFGELYNLTYEKYARNNPDWGRSNVPNDGL